MTRCRNTVFLLLLASGAMQTAVAQIEKQAPTYDVTLEDCLTAALKQNP